MRIPANIYMIDGGEDLDRGGSGTISVMPSMDSIAEFRQLTSNYGADLTLASGATMTLVLKSGSKDFHAGAWEFMRNEDLDANSYFRNQAGQGKALNRLNTFGFNVGGPVYIRACTTSRRTRPSSLQHGVAQAASGRTAQDDRPVYQRIRRKLRLDEHLRSRRGPALRTANCPVRGRWLVAWPAVPQQHDPDFVAGPQCQALLSAKIFPAPNSGSNFVGGANAPTNVREEIVRIDHHFTDKFWLFGHWIDDAVDQTYGTTMWSGDNVPTAGNTFGNPSYSGVIHATYTISPTLLNETAFNYNGNRINILPSSNSIVARPSGFNVPSCSRATR